MKKLSLVVLVVLFMVIGCAMDRNIQTNSDYDGIWQMKMYVGHKYYHNKVTVVNGRFHEKYPNFNVLKGYISVDGRLNAYYTFNHGGWNAGAFVLNLDRKRSTTTKMVGTWSGLDGAYFTGKSGEQYSSGRWEAIK